MVIDASGWHCIPLMGGQAPHMVGASPWGMRIFPAVKLAIPHETVERRLQSGFFEDEAVFGVDGQPFPAAVLAWTHDDPPEPAVILTVNLRRSVGLGEHEHIASGYDLRFRPLPWAERYAWISEHGHGLL
jgi:hypothetical protein